MFTTLSPFKIASVVLQDPLSSNLDSVLLCLYIIKNITKNENDP